MFCASLALSVTTVLAETYTTEKVPIRVDVLASGLEHPWGIEVLPDGAFLVTERPGNMRLVKDGQISDPIAGLPKITANGQGGLLDVVLHPEFVDGRYFATVLTISLECIWCGETHHVVQADAHKVAHCFFDLVFVNDQVDRRMLVYVGPDDRIE